MTFASKSSFGPSYASNGPYNACISKLNRCSVWSLVHPSTWFSHGFNLTHVQTCLMTSFNCVYSSIVSTELHESFITNCFHNLAEILTGTRRPRNLYKPKEGPPYGRGLIIVLFIQAIHPNTAGCFRMVIR